MNADLAHIYIELVTNLIQSAAAVFLSDTHSSYSLPRQTNSVIMKFTIATIVALRLLSPSPATYFRPN